jgi:hypothetical protein
MRKLLTVWIVLAAIVGASVTSLAQVGQAPSPAQLRPAPAGGGFAGPGNLTLSGTLVKYWGWRCVTAAYSGPAIDLVDTATGNTTGTRLMCVSGTLTALVSGSACAFVTGNACSALATTCATSCSVVTKYEQIGTADCGGATVCNLTQATNSLRPTRTTSGPGGNQCEAYFKWCTAVRVVSSPKELPVSALKFKQRPRNQDACRQSSPAGHER